MVPTTTPASAAGGHAKGTSVHVGVVEVPVQVPNVVDASGFEAQPHMRAT
jgi:hypothetical protein